MSEPLGKFLKKFVGHVNVWAARKEDKIKVKDEYNNYRDRSAYMFLLFPSTLLLLRWWVWDGCLPALTVQVYQAWLLFLYTSFALEENVLLVNGRDIRPWCTLKMQSCYMLEPSRASKFSQTIKIQETVGPFLWSISLDVNNLGAFAIQLWAISNIV
uniref:Uncharacterized protein n=1 Tax=Triticum urartu TaxID=4572 RepID=A0A8R7V1V6_TRIUA